MCWAARAGTLAPTLLCRGFVFWGTVAAEQLGQVLGECGARQYHVASDLVRLLLQVALHVRQEADDRSLLQLALEFGNQRQRFGVRVIHVEDDQRWLLFAVLLDPLEHIFFVFDEFDFDVELARRLLNFGLEKQIVHEGEDARVGILVGRERLGLDGSIGRSEAGTSASAARPFVSAERAAIAVIHGSAVDTAELLAIATAGLSRAIRWATSASPSASPSASGGISGSNIHIVSLCIVPKYVQRMFSVSVPRSRGLLSW